MMLAATASAAENKRDRIAVFEIRVCSGRPAHSIPNARRETEIQDEATYICDNCGEEIVVPIDPSAGSSQTYVEDCPVCCSPNVVHVEIVDVDDVRVWGQAEQDRYS